MKEATLKIVLTIAFVICTYVFISIRFTSPFMFNFILKEPAIPEREDFTTYGENYYKSGLIKQFREEMPQTKHKFRFSDKNKSLQEADILIFGDSQFDFSRQPTYAEKISDSLNSEVFLHRFGEPYQGNVISYLNDHNYSEKKSKILIYESTERYTIGRSSVDFQDVGITSEQNDFFENIKLIKNKIFNPYTESLYGTILKKSYMTIFMYSKISTFKFDYFKYMSSPIKDYVINSPDDSWLFFGESVTFYQRTDISDSLVRQCALNVKKMQQKLKENYKLDLIYIIIPEAYSIYNIRNTDKKYHNFIPKMQKEFEKFNIPYIDLYSDFIESDKILYYRTDTHWNENGVDIAVKNTLEYFNNTEIYEQSDQMR